MNTDDPKARLTTHLRDRLDRVLADLRGQLDPDRPFLPAGPAWWFTEATNEMDTDETRDRRQAWFKSLVSGQQEDGLPDSPHPAALNAVLFRLLQPAGPQPRTMGEAFSIVEDGADELAQETADELHKSASLLVDPAALSAVLGVRDLLERWPWEPTFGGLVLHALLPQVKAADGAGLMMGEFPGDATPVQVAGWARDALNNMFTGWVEPEIEDVHPGDVLAERAQGTGFANLGFHLCEWMISVRWPGPWLPVGGIGLLHLAWKAVQLGIPATPSVSLLSVEKVPVRVMTSMAGADPRNLDRHLPNDALAYDDASEPTHLVFEWNDGEQLELDYAGPGANPLVRIAERYGIAAVRDVQGLGFFSWAAGAPAGEALWWWPDEHLAVMGLAQSKDNRRALLDRLGRVGRARMTAHYATGRPLAGPLVTESATDGVARRLHLHPALFRGVTREDGKPGNYWWPVPVKLLRLRADKSAGKVHVLAPVLGQQWRGELRKTPEGQAPEARIRVARLVEKLGIKTQGGRNLERRAADTLRATLDAGKRSGLVGDYRVERGNLDALSGVLVAIPGDEALHLIRRDGPVPHPAWLPATGRDVDEYLRRMGLSSAAAGEQLGLADSTLRRMCSDYRNRPLSPKVRAAFRRHLWPGLE